jgi:hypothetical protein
MEKEYSYTVASESELDELMVGHQAGLAIRLSKWFTPQQRLSSGFTGVVWKLVSDADDMVQPLALVSLKEDLKRLCGRYSQLRSDLSPLTSWCHLLTPEYFESLSSLDREPDLGGLQAAWTGLVVAEALLLTDWPLASIRMPACLATQSFAVARARALWKHLSVEDVIQRFNEANRICRSESTAQRGDSRAGILRKALQPIWTCLEAVPGDQMPRAGRELEPVVVSLRALLRARSEKDALEAGQDRSQRDAQEARRFVEPLLGAVPEAQEFERLTDLPPELRLRLFDRLVNSLNSLSSERDSLRRNSLMLLAGYLATVAAGGAPSLALTEGIAKRWPEVTAWAYLVGGIGERVVWTSSFDGLGRLVARDLMRPLRIDEAPTCDFALDEGAILADSKLADPLVHLRLKTRIATVALVPGVNIAIPTADLATQELGRKEPPREGRQAETSSGNPIAVLADAIWPHLRGRIEDRIVSLRDDSEWGSPDSQRGRGKRKSNSQSQLPLSNPNKK